MPKDFNELKAEFLEQLKKKQVKNLKEFAQKKEENGREKEYEIIVNKKAAFDKTEKNHKELSN